jgi:hypothetical protein
MDFDTNESKIEDETRDGQMIEPNKLEIGGYVELDGCFVKSRRKRM